MGRGPGVRAIGNSIQVDFRYQGERCRERVRLEPTARNLRFAANLKARIEHDIQTGTFDYARYFPNSRRRVEQSAALGDALQRFLTRVRVTPETLTEYGEYVRALPPWLAEKPINQITQGDVERWLEPLNLSRKRLNNLLIPLRGAFRKAFRDGEVKVNPLAGLHVIARETDTEIDPFTQDEAERLGGMWKFWAWTGLRSGEIAGLDWSDVERDGTALLVRRSVREGREKATKTRAGTRRVSLLPPAREMLADLGEGRVFMNPATGDPFITDRQIRRAFRRRCRDADVRYRYPYQLRHTFASWALSSGENPMWVARQMGHKDVSLVLKVYGRYIPEMDPLAGTRMLPSLAPALELP